jgi:hypothetical protein
MAGRYDESLKKDMSATDIKGLKRLRRIHKTLDSKSPLAKSLVRLAGQYVNGGMKYIDNFNKGGVVKAKKK